MTNRLHPIDDIETKTSISTRAVTAALIAGAAFGAAGCEADAPKSAESLTPSEIAARAEVHEVFDNLNVTDIVRCQVARITKGPRANYQGEMKPTLKVSLRVEPGDRYEDSWFADEGSTVGNYSAEIAWMNPGIQVTHALSGQDEIIHAGAAVPEQEFNPKVEMQPKSHESPYFEYSIDNSSEQLVTYVIPINDDESLQGKREMHIDAVIGTVKLLENDPGSPTADDKRLSETCALVDLDVSKGEVKVLSVRDAGGRETELKTD